MRKTKGGPSGGHRTRGFIAHPWKRCEDCGHRVDPRNIHHVRRGPVCERAYQPPSGPRIYERHRPACCPGECERPDRCTRCRDRLPEPCQHDDQCGRCEGPLPAAVRPRRRLWAVQGPSSGAAERALRTALLRRNASGGDDLGPDTRFTAAAEQWFAGVCSAADAGERSPSTTAVYRKVLDGHVLPALGQLRLREVTTSRVSKFLTSVRDNSGPGIAKTCRTVTSGVLRYAQRADAVTYNAARGATPLSGKPRKQPRALDTGERARWLAQLNADPRSVNKDMPDLVSFMLSTACGSARPWPWPGTPSTWTRPP